MKKIMGRLAALRRELHVLMDDVRSDSRMAIGGPLCGRRLRLHVHPIGGQPVPIDVWAVDCVGNVSCLHIPTYCEGVYELEGKRRWRWQQWAAVRDREPESQEEKPW